MAEISLAGPGRPSPASLVTPAAAAKGESRGVMGSPCAAAGFDSETRGDAVDEALLSIIQRTWAEILEVEHIGPDDDFFEHGGNSLIVASAVALLGQRVGIELPMRALLAAPTPTEMVEQIAELRGPVERRAVEGTTPFFPDWVIPLQRHGAARPVFVYPGGAGGIWILVRDARVASLVGRDRPFYGFRRDNPHIDRECADWFSLMADDYIEQMRTLQGSGPYLIYAICSGGYLAWETVKHLLASGDEIAGVLFYEVPLRAGFANHGDDELPRAGRSRQYLPQALPIDLTMVMAEGWQAQRRSDGWREVVLGEIETVIMPGESAGAHDPYSGRESMVAEHIRRWIARSEARANLIEIVAPHPFGPAR